ncbi:uncharacterized protein LOC142776953 [Rhipicephalus microplus]|uniref:uncharacterized protein LOC142776953 n=1 Tax=Rhipicephalus microplus TaxID=6941 RepID=UPI003F6D8894
MARNLSRLECRRPRATSYATRRRRSWSRSRPAVESVSTWVVESGKLRRARPIYRVFTGVAEHGFDQPPHSEQLSQRRPWCDGNSGTFPNPGYAATRRTISTTVASKSTLPPTDHKGSDTSVSSGCSYSPLPPSVVPDFKTLDFEQFHSAFKDCTIHKNPSKGLVMRCGEKNGGLLQSDGCKIPNVKGTQKSKTFFQTCAE